MVFMGVHGMSDPAGFTTPNLMEAETNRAFVQATQQLVVLADHTKWNITGLSSIAPLQRAAAIISDSGLPQSARLTLEQQAAHVVLTDPRFNEATPPTDLRSAERRRA